MIKSKIFIFTLLLFFALSCRKKDISILNKGIWELEWQQYPIISGKIDFKGDGTGIFYPQGTSDKVPINYSINGNSSTFQFQNPSNTNTIHQFDIVIKDNDYQVWEELKYKSTFVIKK